MILPYYLNLDDLEIIIRFMAFQRKLNAFKDFWLLGLKAASTQHVFRVVWVAGSLRKTDYKVDQSRQMNVQTNYYKKK